MTPQEEYLAALPADGSEVKHDDVYWELMRAGKNQAAEAMHSVRRKGLIKTRIDSTNPSAPVLMVARA